jgi:thioesterase domain-containing protein
MINQNAARMYTPEVYPGRITFFRAEESLRTLQEHAYSDDPAAGGWQNLATGGIEMHLIVGNHEDIVTGQNVTTLASKLRKCIGESLSSF